MTVFNDSDRRAMALQAASRLVAPTVEDGDDLVVVAGVTIELATKFEQWILRGVKP